MESQAGRTLIRAGIWTRGRTGADRSRSESLHHWESATLRVRQLGTCWGCPWGAGRPGGGRESGAQLLVLQMWAQSGGLVSPSKAPLGCYAHE